jgi:hypothetical protein
MLTKAPWPGEGMAQAELGEHQREAEHKCCKQRQHYRIFEQPVGPRLQVITSRAVSPVPGAATISRRRARHRPGGKDERLMINRVPHSVHTRRIIIAAMRKSIDCELAVVIR